MTRYAFIAAMATIAISAIAAPVGAQPQTEAQVIRQQHVTATQQAQAPAADGRQLIAELRNCEDLQPQSVRERCAMIARKTGGQGVTVKLAPEATYDVMDQDQFDRFHQ